MSLIVCSYSTQGFLEGEKFLVKGPPNKTILNYENKYDNVIAIGGGALIDTAKILSKNPIVCYPTTASGATATSHAVYWEGEKKKNYKGLLPKEVKFNENFINTLPEEKLLNTKYDAISHCLDVMWSKDYNKVDISKVSSTLKQLVNPNVSSLEIIKLGHKAGEFNEKVPTTLLHSLSYPMTGKYGIPHGKALGFLIHPICRLLEYDNFIKDLPLPKYCLDIDISFIIFEAQNYNKFHNTRFDINLDKLKKELEYEKNKVFN